MPKYYLVFLDDGHGKNPPTPGKRTPRIPELGRSIYENEFNSAVVDLMMPLCRNASLTPVPVAPTDVDTPLKTRVDYANRVYETYRSRYGSSNVEAIYISVHYDALSHDWSSAEGHSIFVYTGNTTKNSGRLANHIAKYLKQGTSQKWRGIREAGFYVLKYTKFPAVLTENGFMSNRREALLMLDKNFQKEVATEHVKGICDYFGVPFSQPAPTPAPKPPTSSPGTTIYYRIVTGSYTERSNAEAQIARLKRAGFDSFIHVFKTTKTFYRVVTGSYKDRENGLAQIERLRKAGFDSFIDIYKK